MEAEPVRAGPAPVEAGPVEVRPVEARAQAAPVATARAYGALVAASLRSSVQRPEDISLLVRRGTFDQVLARPVSPLGFVVTGYVEIRLLGRFLAGLGLLA